MILTEEFFNSFFGVNVKFPEKLKQEILKNQENIPPDKAVEYVLKNYYDEVREAVFEQEAESQRE